MVGIIGNGKSLAKLDDMGSIEYMFYPQLGFEKHIFDSAFAIYYDNELKWHWDHSWNIAQEYIKDTNILKTTYENDIFLITSIDYISVSHNILVKKLSIINKSEEKKRIKLFFYENLRMGEYPTENTVKFIKDKNCIVKYDNKYICSIGSSKRVSSYQCGIRSSDSSAYKDIENGILKEFDKAKGIITDSALCWDIEINPLNLAHKITIPIYIVMKEHRGQYDHGFLEAMNTLDIAIKNDEDLYDISLKYWKNIIQSIHSISSGERVIPNYEKLEFMEFCKRSSLTIMMLCNPEGGIIASPSLYPDYRYVWNRDGSYMSVALDLCGIPYVCEKYFNWCKKTQNKDGSWTQNYYIDGRPRLTAMQNDQIGTTLWAALVHYRITGDILFLKRYWDMTKRGADYLANTVKNLSPCYDLWEEKYGVFAYTLGATYGGLKSAWNIMKILEKENITVERGGVKEDYSVWSSSMENLKDIINKFYLKEENRFAKSINPLDKTIDTSILGLSFPYNLIPVEDPRMISTALQIERAFNYDAGGIGRYPEDIYFGGNPWIITTLWLCMYYIRLIDKLSKSEENQQLICDRYGICYIDPKYNYNNTCKYHKGNEIIKNNMANKREDNIEYILESLKKGKIPKEEVISYCYEKYQQLFNWALRHKYNGLFPEQVHRTIGAPLSAIPLGWSHAFVIMALHSKDYGLLVP
ncbi:MAG TPA: glycosyl hydrolase [Methanothermococcus okinawensis]|uniref:Glycosyl hydrolase n=1 Tax=Methanothermococcus okinawensis TaxID=155863 RepID=A0A832YSI7_9EURY|nr:glycosyl hydrolase [Methanothermococcus okinawensis]